MNLPVLKFDACESADLYLHALPAAGHRTPVELARLAAGAGLQVIALTELARVTSTPAMIVAAAQAGIYAIPAVELVGDDRRVLGYFIDFQDAPFLNFLEKSRANLVLRNQYFLKRLQMSGYFFSETEWLDFENCDLPYSLRFAQNLVKKGYFPTTAAAVARLVQLEPAMPADLPANPSTAAAVHAITATDGLAVIVVTETDLALPEPVRAQMLAQWKAWGVVAYHYGLAVQNENANRDHIFARQAAEFGLIPLVGPQASGCLSRRGISGAPVTSGDRLALLLKKIPDTNLYQSYFKRILWRVQNLDAFEFEQSFQPEVIRLSELHFTHLLTRSAFNPVLPAGFRGCPFILIHPVAFARQDFIRAHLEQLECQILAEATVSHYPELAWDIYHMAHGTANKRRRDLLRFNLDLALNQNKTADAQVIFIKPRLPFRTLKQQLRQKIGQIRFYRVEYQQLKDVHFTAFVHIPDENDVPGECWCLKQAGLTIPEID